MIKQTYQIRNELKKKSWDSRQKFLQFNPGAKFLNSYSIYEALQAPKDWLEIATKCSINPNHEHFGKAPEDILVIWQTKRDVKADEGNTLDDYLKLKLDKSDLGNLLTFRQRNIDAGNMSLVLKTQQVDKLYDDILHKLDYVDSEIWLTSDVGVNLRCDAMFQIPDEKLFGNHAVVAEWKSLDNIKMDNYFNKLIGPLEGFDDCDAVKFTLQTHLYQYVLRRYGIFDNILTPIYNFNTLSYQHIKPQFPYDEALIENIINHAKAYHTEKAADETKQTTENHTEKQ
jgi:hypothetical protein